MISERLLHCMALGGVRRLQDSHGLGIDRQTCGDNANVLRCDFSRICEGQFGGYSLVVRLVSSGYRKRLLLLVGMCRKKKAVSCTRYLLRR